MLGGERGEGRPAQEPDLIAMGKRKKTIKVDRKRRKRAIHFDVGGITKRKSTPQCLYDRRA